jgi:hypothetical protein
MIYDINNIYQFGKKRQLDLLKAWGTGHPLRALLLEFRRLDLLRTPLRLRIDRRSSRSINPAGSHNYPARNTGALAQGRLSLLLALEAAPAAQALV